MRIRHRGRVRIMAVTRVMVRTRAVAKVKMRIRHRGRVRIMAVTRVMVRTSG